MKTLTQDRRYLALLIGAVSLLTFGLLSACSIQAPTASQPTEETSGTPQTTLNGGQLLTIPPSDTTSVEVEDEMDKKELNIELLYLDLSVCGPCQGTEATFDEAVSEIRSVLEGTGFHITVTKTLVENEAQAQDLGFVSSPTIRINGHDMQPDVREKLCDSCSGLCGDDVSCRVWVYEGEEYWAPPKAMIIEAILSEAYGGTKQTVEAPPPGTELPDNLKRFFAAKEETGSKGSSCCPSSSGCCPH